jgi:hypothetical protein
MNIKVLISFMYGTNFERDISYSLKVLGSEIGGVENLA